VLENKKRTMTINKKPGSQKDIPPTQYQLNTVLVGDARLLSKSLPDSSVNVTITSPPYFDLKDYGRPDQIGFGQKYEAYLEDLTSVFQEIYRATMGNGSLWIIVDTFRKDQEVLPLPFDIAAKIKAVGWTLRDIVIWKKERTVPWVTAGATRKIFEYILIFSKGTTAFQYDPNKYRETTDLKRWWVRYPERYNPKGKAPEEIWSYDIPTQGSWGDSYIRHFCPLPNELVARIIQLTTEKGGVVLDPFSGSGTVPTVSKLLDRSYIGFELNSDYVAMFERHLSKELVKRAQKELEFSPSIGSHDFEATIISLRLLKYGRILLRRVIEASPDTAIKIYVHKTSVAPTDKFKIFSADYFILLKTKKLQKSTQALFDVICSKPPLSKFGIQPTFKFIQSLTELTTTNSESPYYGYTVTNSHFNCGSFPLQQTAKSHLQLFSPIGLKVEESND
jgi:DNA modification methylase